MTKLASSYRACGRITRRASSTFFLASILFDHDTRRDIWALYAFCRVADDIADSQDLRTNQKRHRLGLMRQAIMTMQPSTVEPQIWPALFSVIRRHKLPQAELVDVLRGVGSDINFHQPNTWEDLDRYSYLVAGVVGVLMARLLGVNQVRTLEKAKQLGIAMQYTNIIRDVAADKALKRCYLPYSIMQSAHYRRIDYKHGLNQAGLTTVLSRMGDRAEKYYHSSLTGIDQLHTSYQKPVRIAYQLYYSILVRAKQKRYNVLESRIRLNRREKIILVWKQLRRK